MNRTLSQSCPSNLADGSLFGFHPNPNPRCPVGMNMRTLFDGELVAAQNAMEQSLASTSLADLLARMNELIASHESGEVEEQKTVDLGKGSPETLS